MSEARVPRRCRGTLFRRLRARPCQKLPAGGDSINVHPIPSESRSTVASSMEQPTLMPAKCFVRDLVDGQEVNSVFVVRAHSRRQRRNGETFLKLRLGDVS